MARGSRLVGGLAAARGGVAMAAFALVALPILPAQAAVNLVQNGGFEDGLFGWDLENSSSGVEVTGGYSLAPTEGIAMALFEPVGTVTLSQRVPLKAGHAYRLTFDLARLPLAGGNFFDVRWFGPGPLLQTDFTDAYAFRSYRFDVVAISTSAPKLRFSGVSVGFGNAFLLDNIAVTELPEPRLWATMIGGLFGAGAVLRRRRTLRELL